MNSQLLVSGIKKLVFGFLAIALLLFLPAGSFNYSNGWLFIGLLFIPILIIGIVMMVKSPDLLRKRLNANETISEQKMIVAATGVMFVSAFVVAGLNYRFAFHKLPDIVVAIASAIFLLAYLMYGEVLRENEHLSRTIEVDSNQKVIDSGLYGIIRHPMYTSTIFMFLSMPLILGSIYSFFIMLAYPIAICFRIRNEEKFLHRELDGYDEYVSKVKYRILPLIW